MNSAPVVMTGLLILLLGGCQQRSNPAIPLSPISPLGANTRVPPPQTGSYSVPDGYYQGQAAAIPARAGQYAVGGMAVNDMTPTEAPSLSSWPNTAAGHTAAGDTAVVGMTAVQPAAYQSDAGAAIGSGVGGPSMGPRLAPQIPAAALQQSTAGGSPLRPNLRGMAVVDMTAAGPLLPSDPPSLQVVDPAQFRSASNHNAQDIPPAPSFRSLSPAEGTTAGSAAAGTAEGEPQAPTTSKDPSVTHSRDLPWRKPIR